MDIKHLGGLFIRLACLVIQRIQLGQRLGRRGIIPRPLGHRITFHIRSNCQIRFSQIKQLGNGHTG